MKVLDGAGTDIVVKKEQRVEQVGGEAIKDEAEGQDARAQSMLELRRKRNRDSMRRARVRQRAERDRMQKMIDQLESQLHVLIRRQQQQSQSQGGDSTPTPPSPSGSTASAPPSTSYLFSAYSNLLGAGEALRKQNGRLERDIRQHEAFQGKLARETKDELESHVDLRRGNHLLDQAGGGGGVSSSTDEEDVAPLPEWLAPQDKQSELLAFARDMFLANAERTDLLIQTTNLVLGWQDKRGVLDGSWAQFVQTKDFPNESAEALLARTWAVSTNLKQMRKMLKWATGMKLLHRLSDSAVVIARVLQLPNSADPDHPILYRYSLLVCKVPIENGYVLSTQTVNLEGVSSVEQSLSQRLLRQSALPLVTMYGMTFTHLVDRETGRRAGCRVRLAGRTSDGTLSYAHKVLIESLPAVLRWENNCVAPILRIDTS